MDTATLLDVHDVRRAFPKAGGGEQLVLDGVELTADGSTLRLHIPVSRDQLEVLLAFAAGRLGVDIAPLDGGAAPATSAPHPAR